MSSVIIITCTLIEWKFGIPVKTGLFRLGTRGNSRYCYAGLRKRLKLDPPTTPDISAEPGRPRETLPGGEEEITNASSFLIREWVEKLLGVKFESLPGLIVTVVLRQLTNCLTQTWLPISWRRCMWTTGQWRPSP